MQTDFRQWETMATGTSWEHVAIRTLIATVKELTAPKTVEPVAAVKPGRDVVPQVVDVKPLPKPEHRTVVAKAKPVEEKE